MVSSVETLRAEGHSTVHVGDNVYTSDDQCLADLRSTDPSDDKTRIERTKGGLLKDAYRWILNHADFQRWRNDKESRLLWIRGDPGKGKTMLLIGIIEELEQQYKQPRDACLLSYFFCQGTDSRLNKATAVLRGLIYLLLTQEASLMPYIQKKYGRAGKQLFEDVNAFDALSKIFTNMLQDPNLKGAYLIVDALDECETGLPQLLGLIVQSASTSPHVKWIVSSRNEAHIEAQLSLNGAQMMLSLELNAEHVSRAVEVFVDFKVSQLASIKHDGTLQEEVRKKMHEKANGTFLWVALVIQELEQVESWDIRQVLEEVPADLNSLYDRMMRQVQQLKRKDPEFCRLVLLTMTLAYRPLHLLELGTISGLPGEISKNLDSTKKIVVKCGSFLTIRGDHIYFIHQSAKDYLDLNTPGTTFPSGRSAFHYSLFSRSLQVMFETLQRNIYRLHQPGISIDSVKQPHPDPLAPIRYSCVYWSNHLNEAYRSGSPYRSDLANGGKIHLFLQKLFLYWLEALSLIKSMSSGVQTISTLLTLLKSDESRVLEMVRDAHRFILYNKWVIENYPLQVYASALVFSPANSLIRKSFEDEEPKWITMLSNVESEWGPCLQTLEGHSNLVSAVAFSRDGKLLASASNDRTVRLWDPTTGAALKTLEGHSSSVRAVAFSWDSNLLASASGDETARLWDPTTGAVLKTFKGHSGSVRAVAFSRDGRLLASASADKTVRLWDPTTGAALKTLEGHSYSVRVVAFSRDGKLLASASADKTVRLWDPTTGAALKTLEGHSHSVRAVVFSRDGKLLASASYDKTVRLWDPTTGAALKTLKGHSGPVNAVALSRDGKLLASASDYKTVRLWDPTTGAALNTLKGHSGPVKAVAFSRDGKLLVSASDDRTVRLWDPATGAALKTLEGHSRWVNAVAFSRDGKLLASASDDKTVRLWDPTTGAALKTPEGHSSPVNAVAFSRDGKLLASASYDETVRLWDPTTGAALKTLEGHSGSVRAVAFSRDGKLLASASDDETVRLWDPTTGAALETLEGHSHSVEAVTFSRDGKLLASASYDKTVRLWDPTTGSALKTLKGHSSQVKAVAFSRDGKLLASASDDKTVKLWDPTTGAALRTLKGYGSWISAVAFSRDGKLPASASYDEMVRLWDPTTGAALNTIKADSHISNMSSCSDGLFLDTNCGLLHLEGYPTLSLSPQAASRTQVFIKGDWLVRNLENYLWLPPEYRPTCSVFRGNTFALGHSTGRVTVIEFE